MIDTTFWEQVKANDARPPAGYDIDPLVADLEHLLWSSDARQRDELALEILGEWILTGRVDHDLTDLGNRLCAAQLRGIGEVGTDSVLGRSYAARALGLVIERDTAARLVDAGAVRQWLAGFTMWWELEADLRGLIDGRRGVAHAIAHGADLIASAARSRHVDTAQALVLLGSIVVRLRQADNLPLLLSEDDRLAYATMALLHRGDLTAAHLRDALAPLVFVGRSSDRLDRNPGAYARVNSLSWLRALYLQLLWGVQPMPWYAEDGWFERPLPDRAALLDTVEASLREYSSWFRD